MAGRLQGKVAVITGAGQGIGEATAIAFHREGAAVMIAETNEKTGRAVAERLSLLGGRAAFYKTDVTKPEEVAAMVEATGDQLGPIDILVNNAGINVFHEPLETSEEEWRRCFAVDLEGVWTVSKAVLPHLIARKGGAIVNIASSHSFSIIPNCFPYPVAKHGLLGLTRALGIQYAAENIRVNAIAPGYVETPIAVDYWNTFEDPAAERQRAYDLHPPKRIGRPEEVAMTALFLASDEAPFINAACIVIDGGRSVLYHE
jgi:NAD(P)-dependent dehydrogenase (short-subunit alcohol dehydrogenase family)